MSVELLDGATIRDFVEDEPAFRSSVREWLHSDSNSGNNNVNLEEFAAETKAMMLAVANDLGFLPVQMVLEEGSFLKRAVERASALAA